MRLKTNHLSNEQAIEEFNCLQERGLAAMSECILYSEAHHFLELPSDSAVSS
jgi:hypothetical protein